MGGDLREEPRLQEIDRRNAGLSLRSVSVVAGCRIYFRQLHDPLADAWLSARLAFQTKAAPGVLDYGGRLSLKSQFECPVSREAGHFALRYRNGHGNREPDVPCWPQASTRRPTDTH